MVHASDSSLDSFRETAPATLGDHSTFLIANYDRRVLKKSGAGHISPVGAFDSKADRVLILDVATQKYPYTWVPVSTLWAAMNTIDPDSGQVRGYLLVAAGSRLQGAPGAARGGHVAASRPALCPWAARRPVSSSASRPGCPAGISRSAQTSDRV